jgi:hypothetical protein
MDVQLCLPETITAAEERNWERLVELVDKNREGERRS